jgi:hypothetical protein
MAYLMAKSLGVFCLLNSRIYKNYRLANSTQKQAKAVYKKLGVA